MNLSLSFSKYSTFEKCILKYIFSYITKPTVPKEEQSYPLVLGTLTHLFIHLYHDKHWQYDQIMNLKNDLNKLHDLISLEYLAFDFKSGLFVSKSMDVTENTLEVIKFITENEVVFFHALKLFKAYLTDIFPKFESANLLSEGTFNNLYKLNEHNLCMYGSIDLIFWLITQRLKYLYFSDFKTGKSIDEHALNQLYFYYYNICNYGFSDSIVDNPDKLDIIQSINHHIKDGTSVFGIVFKLRDTTNKKIVISNDDPSYNNFINRMFHNLEHSIFPLHDKSRSFSEDLSEIVKDNENYGYVEAGSIAKTKESFHCKYCKFSELCKFRIGE